MGRCREVSPTEEIHLLCARIITFHGLYCLIVLRSSVKGMNGEKWIGRTDHLAPIVQEVPAHPDFAVLALADAVAAQILVYSRAPVIAVSKV